ncbi:MAG: type II secretion system protein N [Burkholderiales bacterium]
MATTALLPDSARATLDKFGLPVAVFLLLGLFVWLLAHWSWIFLEYLRPQESARPVAPASTLSAQAAADTAINAHLFGRVAVNKPAEDAALSNLNVKLRGVFASEGVLPAFAIVNTGAKDESVKSGTEIVPGVLLDSVKPNHILVKRNGLLERINLDEKGQVLNTASARTLGQQASQFRLKVPSAAPNNFTFSRGELTQSLQDPKQLTNLGKLSPATGGGMLLEDVPPGSLAERLGLTQGDVVRQINGQPVNTMADLSRLYAQFATTASITLDGSRGGKPLNLSYSVQQ